METRRVVTLADFGGPEVMRWDIGPRPQRTAGDVLVAVDAIGVNFADTMVRRGEYRRAQPLTFTPGFEVAGRVVEGPAGGPPPGTLVVVFLPDGGGYADHVVAPVAHVFPVRPEIDAVTAASLFSQGVTAWMAVHRFGRVASGSTVLIPAAAGGLGSLCVQLAVAAGAHVIGTASTPEKRAVVAENGATHVLPTDPEGLTAAVRARTDGRGVDVVIDGVGGDVFAPALRALAHNGTFVVVGSASQAPAPLDARALMPRNQTIVGFVVARVTDVDPREPHATFDAVQRAVIDGTLRPQITVLPAEDPAAAHQLIESRRLTGKLVLRW